MCLLVSTLNTHTFDYPEDFDLFGLGQYCAKSDLDKNRFLIQRKGGFRGIHKCELCRYHSLGVNIIFHGSFITEGLSEFIEGYNSISEPFIEKRQNLEFDKWNFPEVTIHNLFSGSVSENFTVKLWNDSTAVVYLNADIFNDFRINEELLLFDVSRNFPHDSITTITAKEFKDSAYIVRKHSSYENKVPLSVGLNYSLFNLNCSCSYGKKAPRYIFPIKITE